jgi:hypothetical protein
VGENNKVATLLISSELFPKKIIVGELITLLYHPQNNNGNFVELAL